MQEAIDFLISEGRRNLKTICRQLERVIHVPAKCMKGIIALKSARFLSVMNKRNESLLLSGTMTTFKRLNS